MKALASAVVAMSLLTLAPGCKRAAPTPAGTPTVTVPSALFVAAAPAGAVSLVDVKATAKAGDRVVFEARVGGRRAPFVENRAIFFVADSSLKSCDQLPGDTCKYPWDYCCETPDSLLKHMATVQILDEGGKPLKTSLQDQHGLAALRTVVVAGTVGPSDGGNFVVNADAIHVKEG